MPIKRAKTPLHLLLFLVIALTPVHGGAGMPKSCQLSFAAVAQERHLAGIDPADEMALEIIFRAVHEKPREKLSVVEQSFVRQYGLEKEIERAREAGRAAERSRKIHGGIKTGVIGGSVSASMAVIVPPLLQKGRDLFAVESYLNHEYGLALSGNSDEDLRLLERVLECSDTVGPHASLVKEIGPATSAREALARLLVERGTASDAEIIFKIWKSTGVLPCASIPKNAKPGAGRTRFTREGLKGLQETIDLLTPDGFRDLGMLDVYSTFKNAKEALPAGPDFNQIFALTGGSPTTQAEQEEIFQIDGPKLPRAASFNPATGSLRLPLDGKEKPPYGEGETWLINEGVARALMLSVKGLVQVRELAKFGFFSTEYMPYLRDRYAWYPSIRAKVDPFSYVQEHVTCYLTAPCHKVFKEKYPALEARIEAWIKNAKADPQSETVKAIRRVRRVW